MHARGFAHSVLILYSPRINLSGFAGSNYIATLTLGSAGAHASYYHKANEQVMSSPFRLLLVRGECSHFIQMY